MGHGIKDLSVHGGSLPLGNSRYMRSIPNEHISKHGATVANVIARMATAPSEPLPQRLAAIRGQLQLLSDYL